MNGNASEQTELARCQERVAVLEAELAAARSHLETLQQENDRLHAEAIERQAKDEELRKSEALYRSLFEISNEGIYRFEFDPPIPLSLPLEEQVARSLQDNRIVMANRVFAQQYGLESPEVVVGRRVNDFYVENSEANLAVTEKLFSGEFRIFNEETEEVDAAGSRRYILSNVVANLQDGYIIGGWGTQIDITELREAQQALLQAEQERSQQLERLNTELQQTLDRLSESEYRYRTLFEISSEGIYRFEYQPPISLSLLIDEQVKLIQQTCYCAEGNQTYVEMYGFENPEEFSGMWLRDFHVEDSEQNSSFIHALVENGHQIRNYESEEVNLQGNPRYFLNNISTVIKDGCAIGGWASQLDITELRLAQQALLQAEQERVAELAKTNQALKNSLDVLATDPDIDSFIGQLLSTIAARFNSPVVEYWYHTPQQMAYVGRIYWHQRTHSRSQIVNLLPNHPGVAGYRVPEALLDGESLYHRHRPLYIPNLANSALAQAVEWYEQQGIQQLLNFPMTLGDDSIGAIAIYLAAEQPFTTEDQELAQALTHQATLAVQLTRLAEEAKHASLLQERNRIAQDIHDTLAQTFGGILIQLQATQYFVKRNPDRAVEQFNIAIDLARQGLSEARRSVWTLYDRSANYQALEIALPQLIERLTADNSAEAIVTITGTPYRLDPDIGQNLLRLAQEAINNAIRHAHARSIEIALHYDSEQLRLQIRDDGCGFDVNQPVHGFGITSMKQRADYLGSILNLTSQSGAGTEIEITVSTSVLDSQPSNLAEYLPPPGTSKPQQSG